MIVRTLLVAAALLAPGAVATAQTSGGASTTGTGAAATRAGPQASAGTTQPRRRAATAGPQQPRRSGANQTTAAGAQQPGRLNLDLSPTTSSRPGGVTSQGGAFAASGPYATPSQMQRYTGRQQINMPRAPVQMFQDSADQGPSWVPR
jgi:hypothetical protein